MNYESQVSRELLISVVILASTIPVNKFREYIEIVHDELSKYFDDYEVVIIEDRPRSIPRNDVDRLLKEINSLRFIELSYGVDIDAGITIGLENSIGDWVLTMNLSEDNVDVILPILRKATVFSADVVIGVSKNQKGSILYSLARPLANFVLRIIDYDLPKGATMLRVLSRNAVNTATRTGNAGQQILIRIAQCGLKTSVFEYVTRDDNKNIKTFFGSLRRTLNLLVFNSTKPLRWMSILGVLGSFASLTFATYSFLTKLIVDNIADGWSSTVILISVMFILLFIILSFFGEYLGRLLQEQRDIENYWVLNERHSSVMLDDNRHNVSVETEKMSYKESRAK